VAFFVPAMTSSHYHKDWVYTIASDLILKRFEDFWLTALNWKPYLWRDRLLREGKRKRHLPRLFTKTFLPLYYKKT